MDKRINREQSHKQPQFPLKPVCAAVLLAFTVQAAHANPVGPSVVNGQASFAAAGNTLTVTNSPGTIINWQGFSIGANEITRFVQQSASSAVLNRVITNTPSSILGVLQSNGRVFLVNPSGIVFGQGATIDVAGMVASTLNLSNADFLAGRYNFTDVPGAQNISNAGNLAARNGGQIYLIAPNVENTGVITAPNGEILLAAGHSVELVNSNDPSLRVNITAPAGDATNVGKLVAEAGSLGLFGAVVRNSGAVSADSAVMQGGKIVFKASQRVEAGGAITAKGTNGGEIKVLAGMQSGAVNVTGALDASAPASGNGGFIETSAAHVSIADTARITTAAPNGKAGTWLIDPQDFIIAASGGDITGATLSTALDTTNVLIQSALGATVGNGDIFVNDSVTKTATAAGTTTLTLQAENNIIVAPVAISSTGSPLNVIFNSDSDGIGGGAIVMNTGSSITSNGGNIHFGGGNVLDGFGAPLGNAVGNATYASGIDINGASIDSGTGNITLNGQGYGVGASNVGVYLHGGASLTATAGNVIINGTGGAGTSTNYGVWLKDAGTSISSVDGNISITGTGGAGSGQSNNGVRIDTGAAIASTGMAAITVNGTGGTGTNFNYGVLLSNAVLQSATGNISVTGIGGGAGTDNYGVYVRSGAGVSSTGAATITLNGTGGAGTGWNYGVLLTGAGTTVSSGNGNISITGTGAGTTQSNDGVRIDLGAAVISTGTASITVNGTGAAGTDYNYGVLLADAGTLVQSATGNISITGQGQGSGSWDYGILLRDAASVTSTGSANINLSGAGAGSAEGIYTSTTATSTTIGGAGYAGVITLASTGNITLTDALDAGTGTVNLRADSLGACVTPASCGSVNFSGSGHVTAGTTNIYYDPTSYIDATRSDALYNPYISNVTGPYTAWMLVNNFTNLFDVSTNLLGNYALGRDIVAGGATSAITFSGQFDGLNHTITDLTSSLFDTIAAGGTVSNVGLISPVVAGGSTVGVLARINSGTISNSYASSGSVSGVNNVGGLVGINEGTITGSHALGLSVSGTNNIGGLVGLNRGGNGGAGGSTGAPGAAGSNALISNSYVSGGTVSGTSNVGGLVGQNIGGNGGAGGSGGSTTLPVGGAGGAGGSATISNSYVSGGTVTGVAINIGGLVGNNAAGVAGTAGSGTNGGAGGAGGAASIGNSYMSGGTVTATATSAQGVPYVGGLAGSNSGSISSSYVSTANVVISALTDGTGYVGGLVGSNAGSIANTYVSGGMVNGNGAWDIGGLAGSNSGSITTSYAAPGMASAWGQHNGFVSFNSGTISNSFWDVDTTGDPVGVVGATGIYSSTPTVNAFTQATYTGFDFTNTWWMSDGNTRPFLRSEWGSTITNAHQLQLMTMNPGANYTLANNLDLAPALAAGGMWSSQGFVPVGTYIGWPSYINLPFTGTFDGQNFTISNLTINRPAESYVGLFGNFGGALRNVGLLNATVSGSGNVGALAGWSYGAITNSYVDNSNITGGYINVGGLVGENSGLISNSHAFNVPVSGDGQVGGLVGYSSGTISNSYVDGNFSASVSGIGNDVGGLVGLNRGMIVGSSVINTNVSGNADIGGMVGYGDYMGEVIANSFVDNSVVTGNTNVGGLVGFDSGEGSIAGSYVTNSTVSGMSSVGGLIGAFGPCSWSCGSIINSYVSNVNVSGSGSSIWGIGGLAGNNSGAISNSYVSGGSVSAWGASVSNIGGLVGDNASMIGNSYVSGVNVSGSGSAAWNIGGLAGNNSGIIGNSYASGGSVVGLATTSSTGSPAAYNIGGLAGSNSGMIGNSYASGGSVSASGANVFNIGGLVGDNTNAIANSYVSNSNVDGSAVVTLSRVGGLAGYNSGSISGSFVDNSLGGGVSGYGSSSAFDVGGLVGNNAGSIGNSYVSGGSVSGSGGWAVWNVGGLAGNNTGSIGNSYVSGGSVNGGYSVGGLVGYNAGSISNSYVSSGLVSGSNNIGGLTGYSWGTITNSHFDVDNVFLNDSSQVTLGGLYTTQFQDWVNGGLTPLNIANYSASLPGSGGAYIISDAQGMKDLLAFADAGYSFALAAANVTLPTGYNVPYFVGNFDGAGFVLSGLSVNLPNSMLGLFNHIAVGSAVSNLGLTVNTVTGNGDVGALAGLNEGAVSNSYVSGGSVNGGYSAGGLVGYNTGSISNSYVSGGSVSGGSRVGGLVGGNYGGTVSDSYVSSVTVNGSFKDVGGLVGYNAGGISNSYVSGGSVNAVSNNAGGLVGYNAGGISNSYVSGGSVTGGWSVGGLVGYNDGGEGGAIANSYVSNSNINSAASTPYPNAGGLAGFNSGNISNTYVSGGTVSTVFGNNMGGLVGDNAAAWNSTGSISNSFWDTQTTGQTSAFGANTGTLTNVTGLTTAEMMTMASFSSAGWNIANTGGAGAVWRIYEGNTTPLLTHFLKPLTATANAASKTYDGVAYSGGNGVTYSDVNAVPGTNVFEGSLAYGGSSQGAINAGSYYAIAPLGLYSDQQGYDIAYASGILTINPAPLTASITGTASKIYDGTMAATLTPSNYSLAGLVGTDSITVNQAVGSYNSKDVLAANSVSALLTATDFTPGAGTLLSNYALPVTAAGGVGSGSISPAALTVSANSITKVAGQADPLLSYMVAGLKSPPDTAAATYTFSGSLQRAPGEDVGNYPVSQGTLTWTLLSANYTMSYVAGSGNFSIVAAPVITPGVMADLVNTMLIPGNGAAGASQSTISTEEDNKKKPPLDVVVAEGGILPAANDIQALPVCR